MRSNPVLAIPFAFSILYLASPPTAVGQRLSVGVAGGASVTSDFQTEMSSLSVPAVGPAGSVPVYTHTYSPAKDYIVGATFEIGLPSHFSVEADGLYRPMNFVSFTSSVPIGGSAPSNTVVTWEFPLLAKYRVQFTPLKPFVEIGPSFRTSGNLNDTSPSDRGATAGAGVEMRLRRFGVSPTVRYTRWAADKVSRPYQPRTDQNQIEMLLGWSLPVWKGR